MKNKHIYEAPWLEFNIMLTNDAIVMSGISQAWETFDGEGFGDNGWE